MNEPKPKATASEPKPKPKANTLEEARSQLIKQGALVRKEKPAQ